MEIVKPNLPGPRFLLTGICAGEEATVELPAVDMSMAIRNAKRLRYLDVVTRVRRVR